MRFRFPIVIIDEDFRSENASGIGVRVLVAGARGGGHEVLGATSFGDVASSRSSTAALRHSSCRSTMRKCPQPKAARDRCQLRAFVEEHPVSQCRYPDLPVRRDAHLARHPQRHPAELHGFIHMHEDTPEFVARYIAREARSYLDRPGPAVFPRAHAIRTGQFLFLALPRTLRRRGISEEPGGAHVSPVLRREPAARGRVQRRRRAGAAARSHRTGGGAAEHNAARIFGADHLFFVTNGTSTSNKIVWHYIVAPGDVVVVDRNCHKSVLHAITMTGAIPVFLTPTRNHYGIIGPIPVDEFRWENDSDEDRGNPFAREGEAGNRAYSR